MKPLVLVLAALFTAAPALAQHAVLKASVGTVRVRAIGEKTFDPAAAGAPLLFGDTLRTGPASLAHVLFPDGTAVLVKENATLNLQGEPKNPLMNFSVGEFLIGLRRKLGKGESFRVRTPAAVAAVRGTLFWGKSDENKDTDYVSFRDTIEIRAGGKKVLLEAGHFLHVPFGKAPEEPKASTVPMTYLDTFAEAGKIEDFKERVDLP